MKAPRVEWPPPEMRSPGGQARAVAAELSKTASAQNAIARQTWQVGLPRRLIAQVNKHRQHHPRRALPAELQHRLARYWLHAAEVRR